MRSENESASRFSAILSELLFGDDDTLEQTLATTLSPTFSQRINGQVFHRGTAYLEHVREVRRTVTGGETTVLEELRTDDRIAGRYLFRVDQVDGSTASFESHIFAQVADDGRLSRMCEVARVVEPGDDSDLLTARRHAAGS